ncbi:MAG TPA: hypothetical protein VHX17_10675 [Candidatus Cybelea sp.]|jgi:hypothetical protein|nr:hypothetical protein [Candidatus Cybelea sp.]
MRFAIALLSVCLMLIACRGDIMPARLVPTVAALPDRSSASDITITVVNNNAAVSSTQFWTRSTCPPYDSDLTPSGGTLYGQQQVVLAGNPPCLLQRGQSVHIGLGQIMLAFDCAMKIKLRKNGYDFSISKHHTGRDTTCSVSKTGPRSARFVYIVGHPNLAAR